MSVPTSAAVPASESPSERAIHDGGHRVADIGFVGLGNLGAPMVSALLAAGWSVAVHDRRRDVVDRLARDGARPVADLQELAPVPIVALAVTDDAAVTDVLVDGGLLEALPDGAAVAVHSTILPATARTVAEHGRARGVAVVDAPVSGGAERARAGELTVFAGGTSADLARLEGYFAAIAGHVVHVGDAGAGAAAKLANQLMMFAALAAAYEACELGAAYGVAEDRLFEAATHSTGDNWIIRNWDFFDRTADEYDRSGLPLRSRPWSKDLWDVVAAARTADAHLPLAGLLAQHMPERVERHAAETREARR